MTTATLDPGTYVLSVTPDGTEFVIKPDVLLRASIRSAIVAAVRDDGYIWPRTLRLAALLDTYQATRVPR